MKIDELKQKVREDLRRLDRDKNFMGFLMAQRETISGPFDKHSQRSDRARAEGNQLYEKIASNPAIQFKVLHLYNESIAFAPTKSTELATAYGNKSALLRRMSKFKYCIIEADKALGITQSIPLIIKLVCRKAECHAALKSSESEICLEAAKFLFKKLKDPDENKMALSKLIINTQILIDNPELGNFHKEEAQEKIFEKAQMEVSKLVADVEKSATVKKSFKIKYSKKYGHHLVAARDFEPGEIMFVEKAYHNELIYNRTPNHCCQCTNFLWTIVPCDYCSWYVYCSEKCKIEAWNDHHELECFPLQQLKDNLPCRQSDDYAPIAFFFKALKEAGSIDQLQAEIEMLDKHEGHSGTTLTSDKKLTSYKTLYLTPNRHFPKAELDNNIVRLSCLDLIVLAKSVLKVAYDPYDLKKLIKDETAVFMAALICKFWMIDCSRTKVAELFDPIPNISSDNPMIRTLTMTSELTSISCMPNICHCPTFDNKIIMYAIEPIEAGSQLFSSPHSASVYSTPKPRRQFFYKSFYEVPCNCRACKNNWDELLNNPAKDPPMCQAKREINQKLCHDMCLIRNDLEAHPFYKLNVVDQQFMIRVRKLLVDAWKDFDMPSQMIFYATKFVMEIYNDFFRPHSRRVRRAHCE